MKTTCKLLIATPLAVLCFLLLSCERKDDLSTAEIYRVINEIIVADSIYLDRLCYTYSQLPITDDIKHEFSADDLTFIQNQQKRFERMHIEEGKVFSYVKKNGKSVPIEIANPCTDGFVTRISFPLISRNRKKVLIDVSVDCNCALGGSGSKMLFEKINGKWIKTKEFDRWIG